MAFDYEAALNAGYSQDQILDYLGKEHKFDVHKALETGYNPLEIMQYLGSKPQGQAGIGEAAMGSLKRGVATSKTALTAPFIGGEEAAKRGIEEEAAITERPGFNWEEIKKKYEQAGLLPAAGEAVSQIPETLAEQAPNLAGVMAGARLGAGIGSLVGPYGTLAGGLAGGALYPFLTSSGQNIQRQYQEDIAKGETPSVELGKAYGAGAGQALLESVLGPEAALIKGGLKGAAKGMTEAELRDLASKGTVSSLLRGTGRTIAEEVPTEIAQQALERAQAGLPLSPTDKQALDEYLASGVGAALAGPVGGPMRLNERSQARASVEQMDKERADEEARQQAEQESRFQNIAQNIKSSEGVNLQDLINRNIGIEAEMSEKEKKKQDSEYLKDINGWLNEDSGERTTNPDGTERALTNHEVYLRQYPVDAELSKQELANKVLESNKQIEEIQSQGQQTIPGMEGEFGAEGTYSSLIPERAAPTLENAAEHLHTITDETGVEFSNAGQIRTALEGTKFSNLKPMHVLTAYNEAAVNRPKPATPPAQEDLWTEEGQVSAPVMQGFENRMSQIGQNVKPQTLSTQAAIEQSTGVSRQPVNISPKDIEAAVRQAVRDNNYELLNNLRQTYYGTREGSLIDRVALDERINAEPFKAQAEQKAADLKAKQEQAIQDKANKAMSKKLKGLTTEGQNLDIFGKPTKTRVTAEEAPAAEAPSQGGSANLMIQEAIKKAENEGEVEEANRLRQQLYVTKEGKALTSKELQEEIEAQQFKDIAEQKTADLKAIKEGRLPDDAITKDILTTLHKDLANTAIAKRVVNDPSKYTMSNIEGVKDVIKSLESISKAKSELAPSINPFLKNLKQHAESLAPTAQAAEQKPSVKKTGKQPLKLNTAVGKPLTAQAQQHVANNDFTSAMRSLAESHESPEARHIFGRIADMNLGTKLSTGETVDNSAGHYDPNTNEVVLHPDTGLTDHTLGHEATHAAISHVLDDDSHPLTQEFQNLLGQVKEKVGDVYGTQNVQEFAAEALNNPEFSGQLKKITAKKGGSIFKRMLDAITRFFGFKKGTTAYEHAFDLLNRTLDVAHEMPRGKGVIRPSDKAKFITVDGKQRSTLNSDGRPIANTPEAIKNFWRWFGDSKVVDAEGKPLVMYHGTSENFNTFEMHRESHRYTTFTKSDVTTQGAFFSPEKSDAEEYGKRVIEGYLSIENPIKNPADAPLSSRSTPEEMALSKKLWDDVEYILEPLMYEENGKKYIDVENGMQRKEVDKDGEWVNSALYDGYMDWDYLDNPEVVSRMKERGYDGALVAEPNDSSGYSWFITDPTQIKSATGNAGSFSRSERSILKHALKEKSILDIPVSKEESAIDKVKELSKSHIDQFKAGSFDYVRQRLNDFRKSFAYQQAHIASQDYQKYLGKLSDESGNAIATVMIDQALDGDKFAADAAQRGKVVIEKNGLMKVVDDNNNFKNLFEKVSSFAKKTGDLEEGKNIVNRYLSARRYDNIIKSNERLEKAAQAEPNKQKAEKIREGIKKVSDEQKAATAKFITLNKTYPELNSIADMVDNLQHDLIDVMEKAGVLSKADADKYRAEKGYVPLYRLMDDLEAKNPGIKQYFKGLTDVGSEKSFEGSDRQALDILDNMMNRYMWAIQASARNLALNKVAKTYADTNENGEPIIHKSQPKEHPEKYVPMMQDGKRVWAQFKDKTIVDALLPIHNIVRMNTSIAAKSARLLRSGITALPTFGAAQVVMDAQRAALYSGVNHPFKLAARVMGAYVDILRKGENLPAVKALHARGVSGGYGHTTEEMNARMRRDVGLSNARMIDDIVGKIDKFAAASDMAQRVAIYEQTMKETGDELLAVHRARNIINWRHQGSNVALNTVVQMVPFLNAYAQSMDIMLSTALSTGISGKQRKEALSRFAYYAGAYALMNMAYAGMMAGDDEYEKLSEQEKASGYLLPGTGGIMIPVPSDVGGLLKALPELAVQYIAQDAANNPVDATKIKKAMRTVFMNAVSGPNAVPQLFKGALEVATNHDFMTGNPIVGYGIKDLETYKQFNDSTSEFSKAVGKTGLVAPVNMDHLIKAYAGTVGSLTLMTIDKIVNQFSDNPKAETHWYKNPMVSKFLADPRNKSQVEDYYDLLDKSDEAVKTLKRIKEQDTPEEYRAYREEHKDVIKTRQQVLNLQSQMTRIRKQRNLITNNRSLSADEKQEKIDRLDERTGNILKNIDKLRVRSGL